jgi:type IV fimbrial biogenesis protein FimT
MGKIHTEGVTLIEAMVTLAVIAVVLAIGIPAVRDIVATNRMSGAVNDVVTSLHLSRAEAGRRSAQSVMCATTAWDSPAATCENGNLIDGWIVFIDDNPRNSARDAGEAIILGHEPIGAGINLTSPGLVRFSSLGIASADIPGDINFLLCDERGNRAAGGVTAARMINMTATGRPHVVTTPADVACP